jgi:hypothetical protein
MGGRSSETSFFAGLTGSTCVVCIREHQLVSSSRCSILFFNVDIEVMDYVVANHFNKAI